MLNWLKPAPGARLIVSIAGFAAVYFATLFVAAGHARDWPTIDMVEQVTLVFAELGLLFFLSMTIFHIAGRFHKLALIFSGLVLGVGCVIYFLQSYSILLSGNLISALAIENRAESRLAKGPLLYAMASACLAWWLFSLWLLRGVRPRSEESPDRRLLGMSSAVCCGGAAIFLLAVQLPIHRMQRGSGRLEVQHLQVPIAALLYNYERAWRDDVESLGVKQQGTDYPFEKSDIYRSELPFARTSNQIKIPNVIVIFAEGTSSRLIGAYGGKYPGLTPNIDRLAEISMRFDNYFNHTAATYRGLKGQLTSGYPSVGGSGDAYAWEDGDNRSKLARFHYKSVPMVLRERRYRSYFISPHSDAVALNTMLRSMSFDKVYSLESIREDKLADDAPLTEASLSDEGVFLTLKNLLDKQLSVAMPQPFFYGTYDIGTHAFLNIEVGGRKYGDGGSPVLNRLHNFDYQFGRFLDYFLASPFAKNTVLIFTADHANFPEPPYRQVAGADLKPIFADRIPLLVYDPTHQLPSTFDAGGRTSVDFAPTLLQILGIKDSKNSFLGRSLFEPSASPVGLVGIGDQYYMTLGGQIFMENEIPDPYRPAFLRQKDLVQEYHSLEKQDRIFSSAICDHNSCPSLETMTGSEVKGSGR